MKVVFEKVVLGQTRLVVATTIAGANVGQFLDTQGAAGKPFFAWPTIPAGKVIAADFTLAPIAAVEPQGSSQEARDARAAINNQLIEAISVSPQDVLTYDPPLQ